MNYYIEVVFCIAVGWTDGYSYSLNDNTKTKTERIMNLMIHENFSNIEIKVTLSNNQACAYLWQDKGRILYCFGIEASGNVVADSLQSYQMIWVLK